jgi:hypothetical protein
MNNFHRRCFLRLSTIAMALTMAGPLAAQSGAEPATNLFKVITVKDEIVIGFSAAELDQLGARDAGAIARTLVTKGTLAVWQYSVHKASNSDLEWVPLKKIGLIAHDLLRVEPYSTPLKILPHD